MPAFAFEVGEEVEEEVGAGVEDEGATVDEVAGGGGDVSFALRRLCQISFLIIFNPWKKRTDLSRT